MDAVVVTHVLCSVENVNAVLDEIHRVLRPNGTLYFLEHVAAEGGWMRMLQHFIEPVWKIFADGCKFVDTWQFIEDRIETYDIDYRKFQAPLPIPFAKPHIVGVAKKKS